jgi:hypothetical protein
MTASYKLLTVRVANGFHQALKTSTAAKGVTITSIVLEALEKWHTANGGKALKAAPPKPEKKVAAPKKSAEKKAEGGKKAAGKKKKK